MGLNALIALQAEEDKKKQAASKPAPNPLLDLIQKQIAGPQPPAPAPNPLQVKQTPAKPQKTLKQTLQDEQSTIKSQSQQRSASPRTLEWAMSKFDQAMGPKNPYRDLVKSYLYATAGGDTLDEGQSFKTLLPNALSLAKKAHEGLQDAVYALKKPVENLRRTPGLDTVTSKSSGMDSYDPSTQEHPVDALTKLMQPVADYKNLISGSSTPTADATGLDNFTPHDQQLEAQDKINRAIKLSPMQDQRRMKVAFDTPMGPIYTDETPQTQTDKAGNRPDTLEQAMKVYDQNKYGYWTKGAISDPDREVYRSRMKAYLGERSQAQRGNGPLSDDMEQGLLQKHGLGDANVNDFGLDPKYLMEPPLPGVGDLVGAIAKGVGFNPPKNSFLGQAKIATEGLLNVGTYFMPWYGGIKGGGDLVKMSNEVVQNPTETVPKILDSINPLALVEKMKNGQYGEAAVDAAGLVLTGFMVRHGMNALKEYSRQKQAWEQIPGTPNLIMGKVMEAGFNPDPEHILGLGLKITDFSEPVQKLAQKYLKKMNLDHGLDTHGVADPEMFRKAEALAIADALKALTKKVWLSPTKLSEHMPNLFKYAFPNANVPDMQGVFERGGPIEFLLKFGPNPDVESLAKLGVTPAKLSPEAKAEYEAWVKDLQMPENTGGQTLGPKQIQEAALRIAYQSDVMHILGRADDPGQYSRTIREQFGTLSNVAGAEAALPAGKSGTKGAKAPQPPVEPTAPTDQVAPTGVPETAGTTPQTAGTQVQNDPLKGTTAPEVTTPEVTTNVSPAKTGGVKRNGQEKGQEKGRQEGLQNDGLLKPADTAGAEEAPAKPAPESKTATLPRDLAGAKPRYGYGAKQFTLNFESDYDKAAMILANDANGKVSKHAGRYRDWLESQGTPIDDAIAHGQNVRNFIKEAAKVSDPGELTIPDQRADRPKKKVGSASKEDINQIIDSVASGKAPTETKPEPKVEEAPAKPATTDSIPAEKPSASETKPVPKAGEKVSMDEVDRLLNDMWGDEPAKPAKAESSPEPSKENASLPKIGDSVKVMGADTVLFDTHETDGVRHELYVGRGTEPRAAIRVVDDSGEVVTTRLYPGLAEAQKEFDDSVAKSMPVPKSKAPTTKAETRIPENLQVHPRAQELFDAALANLDAPQLKEILHLDNKKLRGQWEMHTGTALPRTVKGTDSAIDDYVNAKKGVHSETPAKAEAQKLKTVARFDTVDIDGRKYQVYSTDGDSATLHPLEGPGSRANGVPVGRVMSAEQLAKHGIKVEPTGYQQEQPKSESAPAKAAADSGKLHIIPIGDSKPAPKSENKPSDGFGGLADDLDEIRKILGGSDGVSEDRAPYAEGLDEQKYKGIAPILGRMYDKAIEAGRTLPEFFGHVREQLGDGAKPYLRQWMADYGANWTPGQSKEGNNKEDAESRRIQSDGAGANEGQSPSNGSTTSAGGKPATVGGPDGGISGEGPDKPAREDAGSAPETSGGSNLGDRPGTNSDGSKGGTGDAGTENGNAPERKGSGSKGKDFTPEAPEEIGNATVGQKEKDLISAIETLKAIEAEKRPATPEEQAILAAFPGWGWTGNWLREDGKNPRLYDKVKELLTPEELAAAKRSTMNSHYTAPHVIKALWDIVERLGFKGGKALEPSAGIGLIPMLSPFKGKIDWSAVELDSLTGRILRQLLPEQDVRIAPFERSGVESGDYDLVISNVPFGDIPVTDLAFEKAAGKSITQRIHNYFVAKGLDHLAPGGLQVVITADGSLDASDTAAQVTRAYLQANADLVGAVRLPNNTFARNAKTEVVTDILVFRKRKAGETPSSVAFQSVVPITLNDGTPKNINEYFVDHPEMVLGHHSSQGKMNRAGEYTVNPPNEEDIARITQGTGLEGSERRYDGETPFRRALDAAITRFPKDIYQKGLPTSTTKASAGQVDAPANLRTNSLFVHNGQVYQKINIARGKPVDLAPKDVARIKAFIPLRDAVTDLVKAQLTVADDEALVPLRAAMKKAYDAFVKQNGRLNEAANLKAIRQDPDGYITAAIENVEIVKEKGKQERRVFKGLSDLFTKRTIRYEPDIQNVDSPSDALLASLASTGKVDLDRMAQVSGISGDDLIAALDGSQIFEDPSTGSWVAADEYGSGNVRKKLEIAKSKAEKIDRYKRYVEFLEGKQPPWIRFADINAPISSHWIDEDTRNNFLSGYLGTWVRAKYVRQTATFTTSMGYTHSLGTEDFKADRVIDAALAGTKPTVYVKVSEDQRVPDPEQTTRVHQQIEQIYAGWNAFLRGSEDISKKIEDDYNNIVNVFGQRTYDGSLLKFPGMRHDFTPYKHQINATWRATQSPTTLFWHEVGTGKTRTSAMSVMTLKRLGIINKPLVVALNGTEGQIAAQYLDTFPGMRLKVVHAGSLDPDKRKQFIADIATTDYDAIIIRHSDLKKIPMSAESHEAMFNEEMNELMEALDELAEASGGRMSKSDPTVKELEKRKKKLEESRNKMRARLGKYQDDATLFENLGIDALVFDESHYGKNVATISAKPRMSASGSQLAKDLMMKTNHILRNKGRVIFMSGTPVVNTIGELFGTMRYLARDTMAEFGADKYDAWLNLFTQSVTRIERDTAGRYKERTTISKFHNMPELMRAVNVFSDFVRTKQTNIKVPVRVDREWNVTDKPIIVESSASDNQRSFYVNLAKRADDITYPIEPGADNILNISTDGRKASLDLRLIDPNSPDHPDSKINQAVNEVLRVYNDPKVAEKKGTQVIFLDMGTPKETKKPSKEFYFENLTEEADIEQAVNALLDENYEPKLTRNEDGSVNVEPDLDEEFNLYGDIKKKLIAAGIPESEVAFIHDAKSDGARAELFDKMNAGLIRILLASTKKGGVGVNIQKLLVAAHHLDAGWTPADMWQRIGRYERQGNNWIDWGGVQEYFYINKGTYDGFMWNKLSIKGDFLQQLSSGLVTTREIEDMSDEEGFGIDEINAIAQDNPEIIELKNVENKVRQLQAEQAAFQADKITLRAALNSERRMLERLEENDREMNALSEYFKEHTPEEFEMTIDGKTFTSKKEAGAVLAKKLSAISDRFKKSPTMATPSLGVTYRGVELHGQIALTSDDLKLEELPGWPDVSFAYRPSDAVPEWRGNKYEKSTAISKDHLDSDGYASTVITMLHHMFEMPSRIIKRGLDQIDAAKAQIQTIQKKLDAEWDKGDELKAAEDDLAKFADLKLALSQGTDDRWGGRSDFVDPYPAGYWDQVLRDAKAKRHANSISQDRTAYNGNKPAYETRPNTNAKQKELGRVADVWVDRRASALPGFLALGVRADFTDLGHTVFLGKEVRSPLDAAALAQQVRDPHFETFRVLYLKDGKVVGNTVITQRMPGSVAFGFEGVKNHISAMKAHFGADTYCLIHNHPSGNPSPSGNDRTATQSIGEDVPGLLGHVIIDHNKYAVVTAKGEYSVHDYEFQPGPDPLHTPAIPHAALGTYIGNHLDVAKVGNQFNVKDGYSVLIGRNAEGVVTAVQEVPNSVLRDAANGKGGRAAATIRKFARYGGSVDVFLVLHGVQPSDAAGIMDAGEQAVWMDLIRDIVTPDGTSVVNRYPGAHGYMHGRKSPSDSARAMVSQEGAPYGDEFDKAVYKKWKPLMDRLAKRADLMGTGDEGFIRDVVAEAGPGAIPYLRKWYSENVFADGGSDAEVEKIFGMATKFEPGGFELPKNGISVEDLANRGEKLVVSGGVDMDAIYRKTAFGGITPDDVAAAAFRGKQIQNQTEALQEMLADPDSDVEFGVLHAQLAALDDEMRRLLDFGTEAQKAFHQLGMGLQVAYNADYSRAWVGKRIDAAAGGEPVPPDIQAKLDKALDDLESVKGELKKLRKQMESTIDDLVRARKDRDNAKAAAKRAQDERAPKSRTPRDGDPVRIEYKRKSLADSLMGSLHLGPAKPTSGVGSNKRRGAVSVPSAEQPRVARTVSQLMRLYVDDYGARSLDQVVQMFQDDMPLLSQDDILSLINGEYKDKVLAADVHKQQIDRALRDVRNRAIGRRLPKLKRWAQIAEDVAISTQRSMMTGLDASMSFIQGLPGLVISPTNWGKAWVPFFKILLQGERGADMAAIQIKHDPVYPYASKAGLSMTDVHGDYSIQEEAVFGHLVNRARESKIPVVKQYFEALGRSQEGGTAFLNKLRIEIFKKLVNGRWDDETVMKDMAAITNILTGRGTGSIADSLSKKGWAYFGFAPRFAYSKGQNSFMPGLVILPNGPIQSKAGRLAGSAAWAKQVAALLAMIVIAKMLGHKVETDPRATDFGGIPTKYGIWRPFHSFTELFTFVAQIAKGTKSVSGRVTKPSFQNTTAVIGKYFRYKAAPALGLAIDQLQGYQMNQKTGKSEKFDLRNPKDLKSAAANMVTPISLQGVAQSWPNDPFGMIMTLLGSDYRKNSANTGGGGSSLPGASLPNLRRLPGVRTKGVGPKRPR